MVADEVERVGGDCLGGYKAFGGFAVVGELEEVQHFGVFFSEDDFPGFFRQVEDGAGDGFVPELPADAFEDGDGAGDGAELEFGGRGEVVGGHDFVGEGFFVRVALPFDVTVRVG